MQRKIIFNTDEGWENLDTGEVFENVQDAIISHMDRVKYHPDVWQMVGNNYKLIK